MTMQDVVHQLFSDSVWEEFSLLNKTVDEQEIAKILRRLDLLDYKDKHPMTLSGGQKQRIALAVATLANKDILYPDTGKTPLLARLFFFKAVVSVISYLQSTA